MNQDLSPDQKEALETIRNHVHEEYGIYFPESKLYSLESKLMTRIQDLNLASISEYAEFLEGDPDEIPFFLNAITTNKTAFFREIDHWTFFQNQLIPWWSKESSPPIQIWSGACSTGEEPYTAAMLLENHVGSSAYRILGSDLSEEVIRRGSRAYYSPNDLKPIREHKPSYVNRFFDHENEGSFRLKDTIRKQVYFRQFNLKFDNNPFSSQFDLILLRNVFIYFDSQMIQNVVDHIYDLLVPGGYLFIGLTENLNEIDHELERIQPSVYKKNM